MTMAKRTKEPSLNLTVVPAFAPVWDHADDPAVRHVFIWGGRGGAKSRSMSDFFAVRGPRDAGVFLCTREIQNSIADSVFGELRDSIQRIGVSGYAITDRGIEHTRGARIVFAGLGYRSGVHVKSTANIIRAWVEEAQQISGASLKVLVPTVRLSGSKLYYTFNRTMPRDPIWDFWLTFRTRKKKGACTWHDGRRLQWNLYTGDGALGIELNYDANPYFPAPLEEDRKRDYRYALERQDWGTYNHVWRGAPEDSSATSIITLRQAMEAARRSVDAEGAVEVGADIARGGRDRVVFYKRKGLVVLGQQVYTKNSDSEKMRITQTAERLMAFTGNKTDLIKPDDTGLGGGVTDILEDAGYNVAPVNFAAKAFDYDHFTNVSAELWFDFARRIDEVSIPDDIELIEELVGRREGRRDSRGRRTVEPKDEFMARLGRSPDKADALLLAFYEPGNIVSSVGWTLAK